MEEYRILTQLSSTIEEKMGSYSSAELHSILGSAHYLFKKVECEYIRRILVEKYGLSPEKANSFVADIWEPVLLR